MQSKAATVAEYLASLPEDRRAALNAVREVFRANMDPQLVECMNYGMIGYVVPHSIYPAGYHCDPKLPLPYGGLASQKNHMSLYLMCTYADAPTEARLRKAWAATGKKLDMGKSCIRFKRVDDLAFDAIADTLRQVTVKGFIAQYEKMLGGSKSVQRATTTKPKSTPAKAKAARQPKPKITSAKTAASKPGAKATRGQPKRKAKVKKR